MTLKIWIRKSTLAITTISFLLTGCAAMLIPKTSDPAKKLGYAYQLFDQQHRPLPAEELIRESIEI